MKIPLMCISLLAIPVISGMAEGPSLKDRLEGPFEKPLKTGYDNTFEKEIQSEFEKQTTIEKQ